jgi:predicted lipoprotein
MIFMRVVRWFIAIAAIACVCRLFPLFHVVPLKMAAAEKIAEKFDATAFAENFWAEKILPAAGKAVSADVLIAAIQASPSNAKTNFSRSVGLSDSYFYFLRGEGKIIYVSDDAVSIAVTENSTNVEIVLQTGLVFGDAIRDGTGLLNTSDYPNSQDFNDISAALNHLVETKVLPQLREQAKVGAKISFAGCAEVDDESTDLKPLKVIPIQTKAE